MELLEPLIWYYVFGLGCGVFLSFVMIWLIYRP